MLGQQAEAGIHTPRWLTIVVSPATMLLVAPNVSVKIKKEDVPAAAAAVVDG